jgi:hypothetical protein
VCSPGCSCWGGGGGGGAGERCTQAASISKLYSVGDLAKVLVEEADKKRVSRVRDRLNHREGREGGAGGGTRERQG